VDAGRHSALRQQLPYRDILRCHTKLGRPTREADIAIIASGHRVSRLKRDEIGMNRHRALGYCLSMIFSENRFTLFRIML
jgi:hypothetical protein